MNKTIYSIVIPAILLVLPPFILLLTGCHWEPSHNIESAKWLYWITQTAGLPYSLITSLILLLITLFVFRKRTKQIMIWGLIIICGDVLLGQGIKILIKNSVQEPRPYVVWLEKNQGISNDHFYDLPRNERAILIKNTLEQNPQIPIWQREHWQAETGYSFPSGHVLFSACWALLLISLFWQNSHYLLAIIVALWAESVAISRIWLGMHWASDVIVSVIISMILAIMTCFLLKRVSFLNVNNVSKE
ncbi:phosphatidylglycerophosphatase B [Providencia sneebia]|uniref:undecaprenyl-diphosphate phosphatase n=1 Tax=Providencia sneebia DSM 19967 TaxID=1141660 RepID=K8W6F0_9GAMM|nr:phosphatidylglycerophosphatase B [Providencia sneebia]EKT56198.1 phosphatidylglycerophosphatase B [Providencia sneebia DSM 19967]